MLCTVGIVSVSFEMPFPSAERRGVEKVKLGEQPVKAVGQGGLVLLRGSLLAEPVRRLLRHAARLPDADAARAVHGRQGLQDVEGPRLQQEPLELNQPQGRSSSS